MPLFQSCCGGVQSRSHGEGKLMHGQRQRPHGQSDVSFECSNERSILSIEVGDDTPSLFGGTACSTNNTLASDREYNLRYAMFGCWICKKRFPYTYHNCAICESFSEGLRKTIKSSAAQLFARKEKTTKIKFGLAQ